MKKRILITGVKGFLGGALKCCLEEIAPRWDIYGCDIRGPRNEKKYLRCDMGSPAQVRKCVALLRPDIVFHLAGGRSGEREGLIRSNVRSTANLLDAICGEKKAIRVVLPGSAAEYGRQKTGGGMLTEEDCPRPLSWYGYVKYMQTALGLMFARNGLDVVIARIFNITGPGTPPVLSTGAFARDIVLMERMISKHVLKTGDLSAKRDFLDVRDVCRGLWAVARRGRAGEIYHVSSGKGRAVRSVVHCLLTQAHKRTINIKENKDSSRGIPVSVGSNRKLRRISDWQPEVRLKESLGQTLEYYRDTMR